MYICSITRNCNSLRNKISIYLSIYICIISQTGTYVHVHNRAGQRLIRDTTGMP